MINDMILINVMKFRFAGMLFSGVRVTSAYDKFELMFT